MARVVWSEQALLDLESVLNYLESQSLALAKRYATAIVRRTDQLERFPLSGGLIDEDDSGTYRQVLQGPYRIIYRVEAERVYIVTVHHAARILSGDFIESPTDRQ